LTDIFLFIIGLLCLYLGAEGLVSGSSKLAISLRIRPVVVGLTVIAFGTSAPEGVVSILAAIRGSQGIALGNVIGSNVANIGLALGLSALVKPIKIEPNLAKREIPMMLGASFLLYLLSLDGRLSRLDGLILFLGIIGFVLYQVITARNESKEMAIGGQKERWRNVILTIVGLCALIFGAHLLVESGVSIARKIGISEFIIGLTMMAVGTSLPELAASMVAVVRGRGEISAGNIVGSNIFNILGVLGLAALVMPLGVEREVLTVEYPIMIGVSLLIVPFLKKGFFTRIEGLIFLLVYSAFIGRLFVT
jgi:cation:H+ antiporter